VHVLVFDVAGRTFLQKRTMAKDISPGCWHAACSGHLDSGEGYDVAAARELGEEIGVRVTPNGRRTYIVKLRVGRGRGAPIKKPTIGVHGEITVDEARRRALDMVRLGRDGIDPAAKTVRLRGGTTLRYDRLILSPGIAIRWGAIEGYDEAAAEAFRLAGFKYLPDQNGRFEDGYFPVTASIDGKKRVSAAVGYLNELRGDELAELRNAQVAQKHLEDMVRALRELEGTRVSVIAGEPLPAQAPTRQFLRTETIGVLLGRKWDVASSALKIALGQEEKIRVVGAPPPPPPPPLVVGPPQQESREARLQRCIAIAARPDLAPLPANATDEDRKAWAKAQREIAEDRLLLAYKARPLNGIWATAPYLHNGSVKSLYELLLPVEKRAKTFWVGNRDFDPREVGFVNQPSPVGSWFRVADASGKAIHGNSNNGHDYGSKTLTEPERWALVEYMKTL
jgi:hypothetical protein